MLKETFIALIRKSTSDERLVQQLWTEVETNYSSPKRYYHTLQHLEDMMQRLDDVKEQIKSWDTILFSLYYHDIIYNALKTTNEEKSAEIAADRMQNLMIPKPVIDGCVQQILATKKHAGNSDADTNFFTDADLSILGQPWPVYETYFKNIRKEYKLYPDVIYLPGRKKVLIQFLQMERIYKTDHFYNLFEQQAKQNLQQELELIL
ncbi:MAG: hypothetical protein JST86_00820 [Bacteroidetes bacterium]|nr:hypothetical protein [Bacteroidota bacterium]